MLEPSGELDLALEALGGHAGAKVGGEDLHDDAPAESCIGGDEYARHAAGAELVLDGVGGAEGGLELGAEVGQCLAVGKVAKIGQYTSTRESAGDHRLRTSPTIASQRGSV